MVGGLRREAGRFFHALDRSFGPVTADERRVAHDPNSDEASGHGTDQLDLLDLPERIGCLSGSFGGGFALAVLHAFLCFSGIGLLRSSARAGSGAESRKRLS